MKTLSSVLLVDDDHTTNFLNKSLLTRLQVTNNVLVALNGEQAMARIQELCAAPATDCPTLILLDVNMPGMNGIEFLQAYKQLPAAMQRPTVIVMLTTSLHPRDVARVEQMAVVAGFISKPLTTEKIQDILQNHF
ncbi:response regulator [Hymenobacter sp. UYP22]|uniref:response regulator n=1 Tax=Hymenobacter sp. UYP22 TaxID=3156348 RepID=UPI00339354A2